MTFKRALSASELAGGIGIAGLFGIGLGTASADPGRVATARASRRAATIETTVAPARSTGTIAASTRAALITSRSTGTVSR
jgi:multidrug efflux pump subunit AcrA (membrane-fusion protein)